MRIISGKFKSRKIFVPKTDNIRPTSDRIHETIFNILYHNNKLTFNLNNSRILDLFSGSGSFSFEAISRGAKSATLVDSNKECLSIINKNAKILGVDKKIKTMQLDATQLPPNKTNHDCCFIDPPYLKGFTKPALISAKKGGWLSSKALVDCEMYKKDKFIIPQGMNIIHETKLGNSQIIFLINS